jgi:hypothetical protein
MAGTSIFSPNTVVKGNYRERLWIVPAALNRHKAVEFTVSQLA